MEGKVTTNYEARLSKRHLIWSSVVIGTVFTYAGVEESVWTVLGHLDFCVNLIINTLQAYVLLRLNYYLVFERGMRLIPSTTLILLTFYLLQVIDFLIRDFEQEDYVELYSITLPFGTIIVLFVGFVYQLYRQKPDPQVENKSSDAERTFWIKTGQGKELLEPKSFRYACIQSVYLNIVLEHRQLKSTESLKRIGEALQPEIRIFRLNKQYLAAAPAIRSYRTLKDGRIEVSLFDDTTTIVSKNKAAEFKKWLKS